VLRLLENQSGDLAARIGRSVEVVGVAVRRPDRHPEVPAHLLTTDPLALVTRDDVDLVVEVIGGIEPARTLLLAAFAAGKSVVSANKALLADDGVELHAAAAAAGVDLYYEAAVAGAIPMLRPLRESLAGDQLRRVVGIVNGTTNYILSRMAETGAGFSEALAEATELGYAEADPTADVDGFDAAAKAAILASLAFHTPVTAADVYREGISAVTAVDVARAAEIGCTVKLLAICERVSAPDGDAAPDSVAVRVHPAMIPTTHPLAAVGGAFNAVFVEAEAAGELMFYGRGAGGEPTASAVLGDLVAVARNRIAGVAGPGVTSYAGLPARPIAETPTRYHVSLDVADRPGVLATVAQEFARHGVSIATVRQDGHGDAATLVIVTHSAPDAALSATVVALREMPAVRGVTSVLRVEGL
jgi:homoserine dehydrogenase